MEMLSYVIEEEPPQEGSIWYMKQGSIIALCIKIYGEYRTFFADGSGSVRKEMPFGEWRNIPKGRKITLTLES